MSTIFSFLSRLWLGQYSLGKAFWLFFIFGTYAVIPVAMLAGVPFILADQKPAAHLAFLLVFWGYAVIAAVGVWRSANATVVISSWHGSVRYIGSIKIIWAKLLVCTWLYLFLAHFTGLTPKALVRVLSNG